ncbi:alpha/beta hydrolase [Streptomyces sp. bgisy100]|uniref:alpha/beta hydrolase n=1 Tax=Streptomyces sp. bgisy100 TaxID=3413783 RepID=UPI003D71FD04
MTDGADAPPTRPQFSRPPSSRQRSRRTRILRAGALAAAGTLAATATAACGSGDASARSGPLTEQRLDWESCPAPSTLQGAGAGAPEPLPDGAAWECSTLQVPLDWSNPDGKRIDVALIRVKAKDQDRRLGSLVFNFGGPGASGVATLPSAAKEDYTTLHSRYDLVSFDPRGVGESEAVRCLDDKGLDALYATDSTPDNAAEVRTGLADAKKSVAACVRNSGAVLPHVGTESAARDLDLLREVLGDDKLNYFGISYGTELGAAYAHLFPRKAGRMVLDAVVDPTENPEQGALGQAKGFQLALDSFLKDCAQKASCPTGTDPEQGEQRIKDLLKQLDSTSLPTEDGRRLNQTHALNGIVQALYSQDLWPYLKQGLEEAQNLRTGNLLLALSDSLTGRDQQGHYNNIQSANTAIVCADDKRRYTPDEVRAKLPEFRAASPVFGDNLAWGLLQCTGWPVTGKADGVDVSAPDAGPILVVGNTGDPATPYAGAKRMAEGLGKGVGIEVTNKGQGHGAYGNGSCVTKVINAYLLDGKVPRNGTVCPT